MYNITASQAENALKQARELGVDTKGISPSNIADMSRLLDNMVQRVVEQEIFDINYEFILTSLVPRHIVINGMKEFVYANYQSGDNGSAYAESSINDFKGDGIDLLEEIGKADTEFNKKVEIPRQMLFDMFVKPNGVSKVIALIRKSVDFAMEQLAENKIWKDLLANVKVIEIEADIESFDGIKKVKQTIATILKQIKTTTRKSPYIGTNGVIEIAYSDGTGGVETKTINPPIKINPADMIMIRDNKFDLAETFNGSTFEIEYDGKNYGIGQVVDFDFETYIGFDAVVRKDDETGADKTVAAAIAIPEGQQIYLFHKKLIHWLEFFNTSTLIPKTNKPADIFTVFEYMGTYFRKDVPAIAIKITKPATPATAEIEENEEDEE